jgi:uncharacterized RDD family membrane protein YckC
MNDDGTIRYAGFSLDELRESLAGIDRQRYPRNFENLARELAARGHPVKPAPPASATPPTVVAPARGLRYAGFWQRFGAYWIDVVVLLPLVGVNYLLGERTRLFALYYFVPGLVIGVLFHVWLVRRYGGTPGKRLLGIRIAMVDGSPVTLRAAWLRYCVLFVLSALSAWGIVRASLDMGDAQYHALGRVERARQLVAMAPPWHRAVRVAMTCWIWGEFLTMLFNARRRAVHDYLAGTVVIRDPEPAPAVLALG